MFYSNAFNVFDADDEDNSIKTSVKKAQKKLREIDVLKTRAFHTQEELDKISTETYWQNIANPKPPSKHVDPITEKQRKKRQEQSHNKKVLQRKKRDYAKMQEEETKRRKIDEKERLLREEIEQERLRKEHLEQEDAECERLRNIELALKQQKINDLDREFLHALKMHKTIEKTFRQMSAKYHPDKNRDRTEWANDMQQKLLLIKEKYTNKM